MAENTDQLTYEINFVLAQQSLTELKVQVDAVSKSFAEVALEGYTKSAKEADKVTREFVESAKEAAVIGVSEKKNTQESAAAFNSKKKALKKLNDEIKESGSATTDQTLQQIKLKAEISALNSELTKQAKEITVIERVGESWDNTYNGLVERNKALAIAMKSLPLDDTSGKLQELQAEYNSNNNVLKEFDGNIGNNQRRVGSYKEGLSGLTDKLSVFGVSLGDVKQKFRDAIGENEQFTMSLFVTEKGLKAVGVAFKAIGIGLVVFAVTKLVEQLMKLQPVIDLVDKSMMVIDATFRVLADRLFNLGSGLVSFFKGDWKEASDSFKASFVGIGAEIVNAVEKSEQAADAFANYNLQVNNAIVSQAKLRAEIEKAKLAIEEEEITQDEKLKRIEKALKLEKEFTDKEVELQRLKVDAQQKASDAAKDNVEESKVLEEEKARLFEIEAERDRKLKELTTKRTAILNKAAQDEKAIYAELEKARSPKDEQKNEIANVDQDALKEDLAFADEILRQGVANFDAAEKAKTEIANREEQLRRNLSSTGVALAISALSSIFGESKAFAIASALNNTFQAVTATYAAYPFPFNIGLAGLVGAAGLAQVANIKNTKKGSSSGSISSSTTASGGNVARPSFELPTVTGQSASNPIMNNSGANVTLNVENKIDRSGLALAVREGNNEINSAGISVNSQ